MVLSLPGKFCLPLAVASLMAFAPEPARAQGQVSKPFKISGVGYGTEGLPLPGEPARPHNIVGEATHLGRHRGFGAVATDSAVPDFQAGIITGEFGSGNLDDDEPQPFVFIGANGDQLVCHYGRTRFGATEPGTFTLTILGFTPESQLIVQALWIAEFVPQPSSTGKFAGVTGRWTMYAFSEPFVLGSDEPVAYAWQGQGTLDFKKGK